MCWTRSVRSWRGYRGTTMAERPDIRLTPDEQAAYLRANRKCTLATLDQDGFPHVTAMNFVMRDGAFYMTSYGKAQKVVNIRRNPKTAMMVETGSAYAELKGVMVRGLCEVIEGAEAVQQVFAWSAEAPGDRRQPACHPQRRRTRRGLQRDRSAISRDRDRAASAGRRDPPARYRPSCPARGGRCRRASVHLRRQRSRRGTDQLRSRWRCRAMRYAPARSPCASPRSDCAGCNRCRRPSSRRTADSRRN